MTLLYVIFPCVFATFPYGLSGQVWYLIVSIPDLCLLPYFYASSVDPDHTATDSVDPIQERSDQGLCCMHFKNTLDTFYHTEIGPYMNMFAYSGK